MINIHPKYQPLWSAPKQVRYFIVTGGRGSAKSFSVNTFLTQLTFEKGHRVLFTRYTMTAANVSIIPEFIDKIDRMGAGQHFKINQTDIRNEATGSDIFFKGIKTSSGNQTAALKSLQGVTTWVLEEAEELTSESTFDKIDLSIREKDKHNRVILILNPTTKEHWIYQRFFEGRGVSQGFNGIIGDTCYIHTTFLDNYHNLDQSFINQVKVIKQKNREKYQHQILGGWLNKAEGVIFKNWHFGEFRNDLPIIYGMDFGYSIDPTTLVKVAIDEKNQTIYCQELLYKEGLTTGAIHEQIRRNTLTNDLIVADSAEPRLIDELKAKGINIRPTIKGPDSVKAGLRTLQDYTLVITPESVNLAKELNNYAWSDRKSDTPIDAFNHSIDALRYAVMFKKGNPNQGKYNIRVL